MYKNIIKVVTACFWCYMIISLMFVLHEIFFESDWSQIVKEYSKTEIFIECAIFIIARCNFKKHRGYFVIWWL